MTDEIKVEVVKPESVMDTIQRLNHESIMREFAQMVREEFIPEELAKETAKANQPPKETRPFDPEDPWAVKIIEAFNNEGLSVTAEQIQNNREKMTTIQFFETIATALEKGGEEGGQAMRIFVAVGKATGDLPEDFDWKHPQMEFYTIDNPDERVVMDHVPGHGYVAHAGAGDTEN